MTLSMKINKLFIITENYLIGIKTINLMSFILISEFGYKKQ